ncbi:MAG: acyl-CoA dehydrogenase family protein [Acidimicrobiia bacterium]
MRRDLYEPEHELFRESVAGFLTTEVVPHRDRWEAAGKVDTSMFRKAGRQGKSSARSSASDRSRRNE